MECRANPPLGIGGDFGHLETARLRLSPGAGLFFFTDGLTETRSPDLHYFEERLPDELVTLSGRPATEVVTGIQARAEAFSSGEMRDDLTVLALRVLDPPGDRDDDGADAAPVIKLR